ncbi:hypothetical protein OSB04_002402 [Centaurea solstitialis]|uniref:Cysteine-rich receptor-like protein kinase n=1 Tax=Centaurea solstitialis TaxID=347529 RepID=A0AA38WVB3_9ASTR|nr:hypothetical protein OSB04_002402 [Centaurea solstitialis]
MNLFGFSVCQDIIFPTCDESGNFSVNSTYQRNLEFALSSLTSDTSITYGFYNQAVGEIPDQVNVVALCRGDVERDDCRRCINDCSTRLKELCPNQKGAIGWHDKCMIRYSNDIILGNLDIRVAHVMLNTNNASDVDQFNQRLDELLDQLRTKASSGGSLRKYASNDTNGPRLTRIFGLMQCTPDLSEIQRYNCLDSAIKLIPKCCDGKRGARVLYPSCNIWYEDHKFFNDIVVLAPPPPSTPPPMSSGKSSKTVVIVTAVIAFVILVVLVMVSVIIFTRNRKVGGKLPENLGGWSLFLSLSNFHATTLVQEDQDMNEISTIESLQYGFGIIRVATNDFSETNKLGQGGFGSVYKGKLQNGQEIAVKRLVMGSGQGEQEFKNEVLLLARLQHRNLILVWQGCLHRKKPKATLVELSEPSMEKLERWSGFKSQSRFLLHRCDGGNFTTNSTFQTNLNSVVSSLASATSTASFFSRSAGQTPDTANAIALCRGDVDLNTCRSCINVANVNALQLCPNRRGATVWYDDCMIRYSGESILGNPDSNGGAIFTVNNYANVEELYLDLRPLMDRLRSEASGRDSDRKFASGETPGPGFMTIYGLMQCTPDLSDVQCYNCLETATNSIPNCCNASLDVRILYPSCNLRYSDSRFYNAKVVLPPPPVEGSPELVPEPVPALPPGKSNDMTIVAIIVPTVVVIFVVLFNIYDDNSTLVHEQGDIDEITTIKSLLYSFAIIKAATNDFSENNKLGDGGFGVVYKGKLQNGKEIAVKRLSRNSGQGELEFENEVLLLARLQHRNLVRLLGYSLQGRERLLVYEFVENGSLDNGYMAPEYALHGQFSVKSDVFSFGVLILEIITGHNNHSFQNGEVVEDLLSHVWKCWRDGTTLSLIDPILKDGSNSLRDMIRCIHIGLLCVQENDYDRPTMGSIVLMLGSSSLTLAVPTKPAFYMHTITDQKNPY